PTSCSSAPRSPTPRSRCSRVAATRSTPTSPSGAPPAWQASWPGTPRPDVRRTPMRIVLSDFMSLDGVVQAPGGKEEDLDGGFAHGGWSMPYFDPEKMGAVIGETLASTEALLF